MLANAQNNVGLTDLMEELKAKRLAEERATLEEGVGKRFFKSRHGQRTEVILHEVRKREVLVSEEGRVDKYTLTLKEFQKFYKPVE